MVQKGRIEWIDVCKGIGIILVVVGHSNPPFMKYIYSFHMPLFFLLSGFLLYDRKIRKGDMIKDAKRYLLPYAVLAIINLLICLVVLDRNMQSQQAVKYLGGILYSRGTVEYMPNCSPLWFLTCIFCCVVLFKIINCITNRRLRYVSIGACCFVGIILPILGVPKLPWNIDTALLGIGFMELGSMARKYFEESLEKRIMSLSPFIIRGGGISSNHNRLICCRNKSCYCIF